MDNFIKPRLNTSPIVPDAPRTAAMMSVEEYMAHRANLAKVGIALPPPISGAAAIPLAAMLIPLIPVLVNSITSIVAAIRQDPGVPEDQAAALDAMDEALTTTNARAQALIIRTV